MPVYEYEPIEWDCVICSGRVGVIQGINDPPLDSCPTCGLPVRRVISQAAFKISREQVLAKSGERGFSTFRKVEKGMYEKVSGPGVDMIIDDPSRVTKEAAPMAIPGAPEQRPPLDLTKRE